VSKDKLVIEEGQYGRYRIGWFLADHQEMGVMLGQRLMQQESPPEDRDVWESWMAERTAAETSPEHDIDGYYWETKVAATAALRHIREALRQDRSLPEWAQKALAEGWKPPKGWKA
jgi:hypothetical protein